jgi:TonB family protein
MACFEDKHRKIEAQVLELSADSSPDSSLFIPPPGASELGICSGTSAPPVATMSPEPGFPTGTRQDSSVVLSLIVDTQGKPQEIKVSQSGGKGFDEEAVNTVQKWRFKPGTCDGKPMPTEVRVEVGFRHQGMVVTPRH